MVCLLVLKVVDLLHIQANKARNKLTVTYQISVNEVHNDKAAALLSPLDA